MTQPMLLSKLVGETITVTFNFAEQMQFGETIPSIASVVVTVWSGIDPTPSSILTGPVTPSGTTVSTKVTLGKPGVIYTLRFHGTGSTGAIYYGTYRLAVLSDTGSYVPSSVPSLTGDLPDGIVGAAYSGDLSIAGGYMPYAPDGVASGSAPAWMGFSVTDTTLTCAGTPDESAATSYTFAPQIADAALTNASSNQTINITRITIAGDLGNGSVGSSVSYQYTASDGTAPYTFDTTITGLPTGTSIDSSGLVTGTYSASGTFSWIVSATDANGVVATLADSNEVTPVLVFAAVDNQLSLQKSSDGGLTFPDTVPTGLVTTASNVGVQSAGGRLYHFGDSNQGRVSTDGTNFSGCTGLMSTPGNGMLIKVSGGAAEYLLGSVVSLDVSSDGSSFAGRASAGFGVAKPVQAGSGAVVLGIVGGRFLNLSQDRGATWGIYNVSASISANEGIQFVIWTGTRFVLFANGPSDAAPSLLIGTSNTGLSASWTIVAGPETGALSSVCHGVAMNPTTGRILMVLRNGHSWYSDDNGTSWTRGSDVPYGSPLNYPPSPGNNMIFAGSGFLFCSSMGGGVNSIYRTTDGVAAWSQVYTRSDGNAINSLATF